MVQVTVFFANILVRPQLSFSDKVGFLPLGSSTMIEFVFEPNHSGSAFFSIQSISINIIIFNRHNGVLYNIDVQ